MDDKITQDDLDILLNEEKKEPEKSAGESPSAPEKIEITLNIPENKSDSEEKNEKSDSENTPEKIEITLNIPDKKAGSDADDADQVVLADVPEKKDAEKDAEKKTGDDKTEKDSDNKPVILPDEDDDIDVKDIKLAPVPEQNPQKKKDEEKLQFYEEQDIKVKEAPEKAELAEPLINRSSGKKGCLILLFALLFFAAAITFACIRLQAWITPYIDLFESFIQEHVPIQKLWDIIW